MCTSGFWLSQTSKEKWISVQNPRTYSKPNLIRFPFSATNSFPKLLLRAFQPSFFRVNPCALKAVSSKTSRISTSVFLLRKTLRSFWSFTTQLRCRVRRTRTPSSTQSSCPSVRAWSTSSRTCERWWVASSSFIGSLCSQAKRRSWLTRFRGF